MLPKQIHFGYAIVPNRKSTVYDWSVENILATFSLVKCVNDVMHDYLSFSGRKLLLALKL